MKNSLEPDQDRRCVGPDLGPNCLQRLSADDILAASKERVYPTLFSIIIRKPDVQILRGDSGSGPPSPPGKSQVL